MINAAQTLADLKALKELLSKPERWTQGAYARDIAGHQVSEEDSSACCFCLSGAMYKVSNGQDSSQRWDNILEAMFPGCHCGAAIRFNEQLGRTHQEILGKINEGIVWIETELVQSNW